MLCAALNVTHHNILRQRLEKNIGNKETALQLFESYLSDRNDPIHCVNGESPSHTKVSHSLPQGSM